MDLAVSVQTQENPTGPLIGLGAGPVDLKFAILNTKVRLKYRFCYHILEYHPRSSRDCGILVCFLVFVVDILVGIVEL